MEPVNEYLSINEIRPDKLVTYEKWLGEGDMSRRYLRIGMLAETPGSYHKYIDFNKFTRETYPIPADWLDDVAQAKDSYDADDGPLDEYIANDLERRLKWINSRTHGTNIFHPAVDGKPVFAELISRGATRYDILDNGGTSFIVLIDYSGDLPTVYVYNQPTGMVMLGDEEYPKELLYTHLACKYVAQEVFVGKSPHNKMTDYSGGHGPQFDGNTLLLRIGATEYRYACIMQSVIEFTTDEKITDYTSSVGNSSVPYPYAESANWCYDMDGVKYPMSSCGERKTIGCVMGISDDSSKLNIECIVPRDFIGMITPIKSKEMTNLVRFNAPTDCIIPKNTSG